MRRVKQLFEMHLAFEYIIRNNFEYSPHSSWYLGGNKGGGGGQFLE